MEFFVEDITSSIMFKRLHPEAILPKVATAHSAGADLCSVEEKTLLPGQRAILKTGWAIQLPLPEMYVQIVPRSGLAAKHGITVLNAPGTIDSDYRGEIGVVLINLGQEPYTIQKGERIAQMIVAVSHTMKLSYSEVQELSDTDRGEGGFGSTGRT